MLKGEQINNGAGKKVREGGRGPGGEGAGLGKEEGRELEGRELEGPDRRGPQCRERWGCGGGQGKAGRAAVGHPSLPPHPRWRRAPGTPALGPFTRLPPPPPQPRPRPQRSSDE